MKKILGYVFLVIGSTLALLFLISFIININSVDFVSLSIGTVIWETVCFFLIRLGIKWTKKKIKQPNLDQIGKE